MKLYYDKNEIGMANCGSSATDFARSRKDVYWVKEGLLEFSWKMGASLPQYITRAGRVTMARLSLVDGEYVMLITAGETIEYPREKLKEINPQHPQSYVRMDCELPGLRGEPSLQPYPFCLRQLRAGVGDCLLGPRNQAHRAAERGKGMNEIILKPRTVTAALAREMEEHKLVSFLAHPADGVRAALIKDYLKGADFPAQTHVFHSVTITYRDVFLASHPAGQDEIVFNWDAAKRSKPLFYVFALCKRQEYLSKLKSGRLDASDYLAIRAPMNDPRFGIFAIWHGTVHCECTDPDNPAETVPVVLRARATGTHGDSHRGSEKRGEAGDEVLKDARRLAR